MNLTAAEKKTLAVIAALVVLFGAVVVGTATVLARSSDSAADHRPYLQIAVDDQLTTVYPIIWCDIRLRECDPPIGTRVTNTKTRVPVRVGQTALVSVSAEIAQGPWSYTAEYYTPQGIVLTGETFASNTQYTVAIPSTLDRTLLTIEVRAPSAVSDGDNYQARGFLAADTTPMIRSGDN